MGRQSTDEIIVVPDFGFCLFAEDQNGHIFFQPLYILPLWVHGAFVSFPGSLRRWLPEKSPAHH